MISASTKSLLAVSATVIRSPARKPSSSHDPRERVIVSPVAPTSIGRRFQDILGEANQALAAAASRVVLVVAGKGLELT